MFARYLAVAALFGAAAMPMPALAGLLANASFEAAPTTGFNASPFGLNAQNFPGAAVTSQYVTGWTIADPGVANLYRGPNTYSLIPAAAFEGQQYLSLNWSPLGGIILDNRVSQAFVLGSGATGIDLRLAMAVEAGWAGSTLQALIRGTGGATVAQSPLFSHGGTVGTWAERSWITALGAGAYTLELHGIGAGNAWDVLVDDVRLESVGSAAAVPEPATWALLITGFGLTGAAMRRTTVATRHAK